MYQASQAAERALIPLTPRPCFVVSSVTTPLLYSINVSQALRIDGAGYTRRSTTSSMSSKPEIGSPATIRLATERDAEQIALYTRPT